MYATPCGGGCRAGEEAGSCNFARCPSASRVVRRSMCPMPRQDQDVNWGRYAGIGLQMLVGVGLGYVVGSWLDRKYGWAPWGVMVGSMLGLAGGMYLLIKDAIRINKD